MHEPASRSDARENRARLIDAARVVFAERGVSAEIKDIADRAGVGVGTLYRNFATKEELVQAMVGEIFGHLEDALTVAEAIPNVREALQHLFRSGWALVDTACKPHGLEDEFVARVTALVQRGVDQGELRGDVPAAFLTDFLDVSMPFIYLHLRTKWSADEAAAYCERVLMSAITGTGWPPDTAT